MHQTQTLDHKTTRLAKQDSKYLIRDLFIYSSLVCNKSCHHCFVHSTPTNHTLDELSSQDLAPVLDDLRLLGQIENIYFTGGEPFINKDILNMLRDSLAIAPLTIYTNASKPLLKKMDELKQINIEHKKLHNKSILMRISLDHINQNIHDEIYGRGQGAFQETLEVCKKLALQGFDLAITTQKDIHDHLADQILEKNFHKLFSNLGIELNDVKILPDIPHENQNADQPDAKPIKAISQTEFCMSATDDAGLMCHTGRTIVKQNGIIHFYPCTLLVPNSPKDLQNNKYSMGSESNQALGASQVLDHPACRSYCVSGKQSCAN